MCFYLCRNKKIIKMKIILTIMLLLLYSVSLFPKQETLPLKQNTNVNGQQGNGPARCPSVPYLVYIDGHSLFFQETETTKSLELLIGEDLVYGIIINKGDSEVELPSNLIGNFLIRLTINGLVYEGAISLE